MNNQEYWKKRNEDEFLAGEKDGLQLANDLKQTYSESLKRLTSELYIFYNEYAKEGQLDLQSAKKLLTKDELKSFKKQLNEFIKYAKSNNYQVDSELKMLQIKSKISRLQALESQINFELTKLSGESENKLESFLSDIYENNYYKTIFNFEKDIGFKVNFVKLNKNLINKAISKQYNGTNYSQAIWNNKDNLMNILTKSIPQGLVLGYNPKKLANIVSKKLDTNYNSTVRLIRTEYNALLNDSSADSYKQCGIDQYQISATLDNRTSEICQDMDLQIFNLTDREVGVNYPPFHPNCRTTTIPYFEPDEIDEEFGIGTRLAKDKNGNYYKVPANMSYKQWKDENVNYTKTTELPTMKSNNELNKDLELTLAKTYDENRLKFNMTSLPYNKLTDNTKDILFGVNFGNMDNKLANAWVNQFKDLSDKYYTTCIKVEQERLYNPDGKYAKATYNRTELRTNIRTSTILINDNLTDYDKFIERLDKNIELNNNVKIMKTDYDKYLATHEFAHTLSYIDQSSYKNDVMNMKSIKSFNKDIKNLYEDYTKDLNSLKEESRQLDNKFVFDLDNYTESDSDRRKELNDKINTNTISLYAQKNADEFMAEAFTDYILGIEKSPYSIKVGKLIDKLFKK